MGKRAFGKHLRNGAVVTATILSLFTARAAFAEAAHSHDDKTQTPIKHVVIIIGENRTFDHIFATYQPVHREDTISNLLSKGIVKADGTPGPNYNAARQYSATDTDVYQLAPPRTPYVDSAPGPDRRTEHALWLPVDRNHHGHELRHRGQRGEGRAV